MIDNQYPIKAKNIAMIEFIARKLEEINDEIVYIGGSTIIISVLDGRPEIVQEISTASESLKSYIINAFNSLMDIRQFREALPAHVNYGEITYDRASVIWERMKNICS